MGAEEEGTTAAGSDLATPNTFVLPPNGEVVVDIDPPKIEVVDGDASDDVAAPKAGMEKMLAPAATGVGATAVGLHTFRPWKRLSAPSIEGTVCSEL